MSTSTPPYRHHGPRLTDAERAERLARERELAAQLAAFAAGGEGDYAAARAAIAELRPQIKRMRRHIERAFRDQFAAEEARALTRALRDAPTHPAASAERLRAALRECRCDLLAERLRTLRDATGRVEATLRAADECRHGAAPPDTAAI